MSSSVPLRLGIVGCGVISHVHARAASAIPDQIRIVSCCDIRQETAEAWAKQYGCDGYYTDYVEMIQREDLDGILLATWPNQHREQIESCLRCGVRSILCEKALTLTGREAIEIRDLVREHNAFVTEGFMYLHHPAVVAMERLVASGELGAVDSVRADFSDLDSETAPADDTTRNWRQRKECGGGVPYDFACYCVNACGRFAGDIPTRVYCLGDVSPHYDTINRMHGFVEYGNGCVGVVESSKKADHSQRLEIVCTHGRLVLPISWTIPGEIKIVDQRSLGWADYRHAEHFVKQANAYQHQLENFAAVIRCEAEPVLPLDQSVLNIFTIEALVMSLLERRVVDLDLPGDVVGACRSKGGEP